MARHALSEHRGVVLVLALFLALGLVYSVTTPLFEAPDEQLHYAFVQYVAAGHGLPVQAVDHRAHLAAQEGSQPPLYYLLAAAATFWIDTSDYPGIVWQNPHYGYNVPGVVDDNKNLFIHTSLEDFPYHGAALAIHLARLVSLVMGALAVLFTYLLTLGIFPDREYLAASAAALVAFVPQFLFISSAASNDSTIVALSALSLWMMVRLLVQNRARRRAAGPTAYDGPTLASVLALGAAAGLAALAKVSGLGLALLGALVLGYVTLVAPRMGDGTDSPDSGKGASTAAAAPRLSAFVCAIVLYGVVVALVAGWWYARNWTLYGELTGTAMMVSIFGARQTPLTATQLVTQLREVWETFWVGFGWGNVRANAVVYAALEVMVGLSGLGLIAGLVRRRDRMRVTLVKAAPFFVLAAWMAIAGLELVSWMETTQSPHGRLLFPALPALAPLAAFGLSQWLPWRVQPLAARAMAAALFALAAVAPFAILKPAYAYPAAISPAEVQNLPHRVDIDYGHQLELLGYDVSTNRVSPGGSTTLTLYWQALAKMDQDYSVGIHVLHGNGSVIAARDSYPGHGMLPTRLWYAGQMIRDTYWLPIAADAPSPSVGRIEVSLYLRETKQELTAFDPQGKSITPIVGALKVGTLAPVAVKPQQTTDYVFDGKIDLIGYDATLTRPAGRAPRLDLALYWKRMAPVSGDYTVFVHVLDANGNIVAQRDQQPDGGDDPTSLWDDGEIVPDHYAFDLPSRTLGAVLVETGLYLAETGQRLPVADGGGNAIGDRVMFKIGAAP